MVKGEGVTAQGLASPAKIQKHLKGIGYPASKQKLIDRAISNNAPSDVMNILDMLPEKDYRSPTEVMKEVGKKE